jgi:hypothetical protein
MNRFHRTRIFDPQHGLDRMIARHSHLKCGQTKVSKPKEPKCVLTLV